VKIVLSMAMALLALAPAHGQTVEPLSSGQRPPLARVVIVQDPQALDAFKPRLEKVRAMVSRALTKEGKVVAVYFWSSDCPYGPPNFENIKKVDATFADSAKVKLVIVSSFGEPEAKASAWAKDAGIKSSFLYDSDKKLAKHFNPRKVNATFVIDAKGNLFYRGGISINDYKENLLLEAIKAALDGKPAPASDQKFEGCGIRAS
jgi:thiol-disulfide isomerase/thioredoxin